MVTPTPSHTSSPPPEIIVEGLEVKTLDIPALKIFRGDPKVDLRGTIMPTFNRPFFGQLGIDFQIVHENHCLSPGKGTVRGFHYQLPPHGQAKLIRVTRGKILDVNIDLRKSSPTFGQYLQVELSPESWNQIFVPEGFAHCYCTLEDHTEVIFKLGSPFAPSFARGLAWNDPDLQIPWPVSEETAIVLERDLNRPRFSALTEWFP